MPILNNYDPAIGSGGTVTGGSFNNAPYPFSLTTFVPIPLNDKFLLIPARQESREINLSFSKPVDLYYGTDDTPFKYLSTIEAYKDTQLGVDLWVKCLESDCQCLIVIRSEKAIDYIGTVTPTPTPSPTPPPPQPWAIIAPDQMSVFIDSSKFPNSATTVECSVIVPDYQSIPDYQYWDFISIDPEPDSNWDNNIDVWEATYDENGDYAGKVPKYPQFVNEAIFTIGNDVVSIIFNLANEYDFIQIKILSFDLSTNTFTLGV